MTHGIVVIAACMDTLKRLTETGIQCTLAAAVSVHTDERKVPDTMKKYVDADLLKAVVLQRQFIIGQNAAWYVLGLIDSRSTTEERVIKEYCEPRNLVVIAAEDLHAIDPVKHGRWIRKTDTRFGPKLNDLLICSECNIAFSTEDMKRRSYCPNCGARMDGEETDEEKDGEENG